MTMTKRSYKEETAWRMIQSFLPEENRITDEACPEEEYVTFGDFCLHVDHYPQSHSRGTVVIFHGAGHFPIEQQGLHELEYYNLEFMDKMPSDGF